MPDGIIRRTADIMELMFDKRDNNVQSIQLQTSADMTSWTTRATIANKVSPVAPGPYAPSWRGKVYYEYTLSDDSLTVPLFLRWRDLDGGSPVATSDVYLAMEPASGSHHFWLMTGTSPAGAALANSTKIVLPPSVEFAIVNTDGSNDLIVAFNENGPEKTLGTGDTLAIEGRVSKIWMRGDGGTADFELRISSQY